MRLLNNVVIRGLVFLFLLSSMIAAQTVTYQSIPLEYQLYPRDEADNDSAVVTIGGIVDGGNYDSVIVDVYKDDVAWKSWGVELSYGGGVAPFLLAPKIHAELAEYKFNIRMGAAHSVVTDTLIDSVVCGDVYLIMGQSNAEASAEWGGFVPYQVEWVRSFGTSEQAATMTDSSWDIAQALEIRTHAAIGIWALGLGKLIAETYDIPVCFINGALGGTAIYKHIKHPAEEIYWNLLWRAQEADVVDDVKAIIWNQGENNTKDNGATNEYNSLFPRLRDSLRADYTNLSKIYTAQIHVGWDNSDWHFGGKLRGFQRTLAEGDADTEIMTMHNLPGFNGAHYTADGYDSLAFRLFRQIRRDFYGSSDIVDIDPPNISRAYFTDAQKDVLVLEFDNTNTLILQNDSTVNSVKRYLKDYFYFHNAASIDSLIVDTVQVFGNLLRLELNTSSSATLITYLPDRYYNGTTESYVGPWLKSSREIPALSFYQFAIDPGVEILEEVESSPQGYNLYQNYPNPFNPSTNIAFFLPQQQHVLLRVFDILGEEVEILIDNRIAAGYHEVPFEARNLRSGHYFYEIRTPEYTDSRKMLLLK